MYIYTYLVNGNNPYAVGRLSWLLSSLVDIPRVDS